MQKAFAIQLKEAGEKVEEAAAKVERAAERAARMAQKSARMAQQSAHMAEESENAAEDAINHKNVVQQVMHDTMMTLDKASEATEAAVSHLETVKNMARLIIAEAMRAKTQAIEAQQRAEQAAARVEYLEGPKHGTEKT